MKLNCNICNTAYSLINDAYICKEGHVAPFSHETANIEDEAIRGKGKKMKKDAVNRSLFDEIKIITGKIYFKIKAELGFTTDIPFKIYLSFIVNESKKPSMFSFKSYFTVFYYSLRIKYESEGKPLFYSDFYEIFMKTSYYKTLMYELKNIRAETIPYSYRLRLFDLMDISIGKVEEQIRCFSEPLYKNEELGRYTEGVLVDFNEENKRIFRSLVRRDHEMFHLYLEPLIDKYAINRTDEMYYMFNLYINVFDFEKTVFVPEIFISCFLYIYLKRLRNRHLINIEKAVKNICVYKDMFKEYQNYCKSRDYNIDDTAEVYGNDRLSYEEPPFILKKSFRKNLTNIFCIYMEMSYGLFHNRIELCLNISNLFNNPAKLKKLNEMRKKTYLKIMLKKQNRSFFLKEIKNKLIEENEKARLNKLNEQKKRKKKGENSFGGKEDPLKENDQKLKEAVKKQENFQPKKLEDKLNLREGFEVHPEKKDFDTFANDKSKKIKKTNEDSQFGF